MPASLNLEYWLFNQALAVRTGQHWFRPDTLMCVAEPGEDCEAGTLPT